MPTAVRTFEYRESNPEAATLLKDHEWCSRLSDSQGPRAVHAGDTRVMQLKPWVALANDE
jgi:hypothetical protein